MQILVPDINSSLVGLIMMYRYKFFDNVDQVNQTQTTQSLGHLPR